jgi:hypothetical protein
MALLVKGQDPPTSAQITSIDKSNAMPSKYASTLTIPPAFPPILREFTKEVLRNQPANIAAFGVEYFTKLQQKKGKK